MGSAAENQRDVPLQRAVALRHDLSKAQRGQFVDLRSSCKICSRIEVKRFDDLQASRMWHTGECTDDLVQRERPLQLQLTTGCWRDDTLHIVPLKRRRSCKRREARCLRPVLEATAGRA